MRYLSVDLGARRIGLAVCDEAGKFASPYGTRERLNNIRDVEMIIETGRGLAVEGVVVGLPRNPNGEVGESEISARKFASNLQRLLAERKLPWPVELWNESFSTREAHVQMRTFGISQKRGREDNGPNSTDAIAASMILQNFLDQLRDAPYYGSSPEDNEDRVLDDDTESGDVSYSPKDLF